MKVRPNFEMYGSRSVIWFTMLELDYQDMLADSQKVPMWQSWIPAPGSQWRQDQQSNHGGAQRRSIYFVPRTNIGEPETERGKLTGYACRDVWEEEFQAEYPNDTFMVAFDFATGSGLGEYPLTWSSGWGGKALYILTQTFLQSFSPSLDEFNNQAAPRWSSVSAPQGSRLGDPGYVTLMVRYDNGYVVDGNDPVFYYLYSSAAATTLLHMTDCPTPVDYQKVRNLSLQSSTTGAYDWTVDIVRLTTDGLWDQKFVAEKGYTDTWATLSPYVRNTATGDPLSTADVT